jgi:hypothetical protein
VLGFITSNVGRLVAYWSVENMTLGAVTQLINIFLYEIYREIF